MNVRSLGPLRVASVSWQSPRGGWVQTVVAKATFDLVPGEARLAEKQDEPAERDRPFDDLPAIVPLHGPPPSEASKSTYVPSDLAPFKPHADVVLVGHAFAPREEPVRALMARLVVGELDKSVEVVADRTLSLEGELREGARFTKMPLRYERAAGGPDTWNPVGVRLDAVDALGRATLPNLQPPGTVVRARGDVVAPTGFGPLSEAWWSRRERLGRHAKTWQPARFGERPLPDDIDPTYFNAAPRDQQLLALRDDAPLALENLHPQHPRLVTRLPGIRPRAFVEHEHGPANLRMAPDTLWIDTDRCVATVTWRGQVLLERPQQAGTVYVALERGTTPVTWGDVLKLLDRKSTPPSQRPQATEPGLAVVGDSRALPFEPPRHDAPVSQAPLTIGQAVVAAQASSPASGAAPERPRGATPATEDLMTLAGAIGSGKAPPWLAMHAARAAGGATRGSEPPPTAVASTLPEPAAARSAALEAAKPPSSQGPPVPPMKAPTQQEWPPRVADLDMTLSSPTRSGTVPIATAPRAAASGGTLRAPVDDSPSTKAEKSARHAFELVFCDDVGAGAGEGPREPRAQRALVAAKPLDASALDAVFAAAIDATGAFTPPLVRVDGELELVVEELERLKVMLGAAAPFAARDAELREAIAAASVVTASAPRAIVEVLIAGLKEPLLRASRGSLGARLDGALDAALAEARGWSRRVVFGGPCVVARLHLAGASEPVPVYVPEAADKRLPVGRRLQVSLLATVHPRQDPSERARIALRPAALACRFDVG